MGKSLEHSRISERRQSSVVLMRNSCQIFVLVDSSVRQQYSRYANLNLPLPGTELVRGRNESGKF